jgi:uncharacterized protein (TIRG00374 family)
MPAALVAVLLLRLLGEMEWRRAAAALSGAQASLVVLAALLNLSLNSAVRIARRAELLRPLPHPGPGIGFGELAGLFFTNFAANSLIPARAGDALFVGQLHRRHGYPLGALIGAQLVEKVVEATSLWVLAWPVAYFLVLPPGLARPLHAFLGVGLVCLPLLALVPSLGGRTDVAAVSPEGQRGEVAKATLRGHLKRQLDRLREALHLLNRPRVWSRAVLWSCASDLIDSVMIGLCLAAVGIRVAPGVWFVVLLAVNCAMLVPVTPGQVGVLEAGAVLALRLINVGPSEALVFALLYHATHLVPMSLAGVLSLVHPAPPRWPLGAQRHL